MVTEETKKVKRKEDEELEERVVRAIDFATLGRAVSDERIVRKVTDVQKDFEGVYTGLQGGIYSLDEVAMKDAPKGTKLYKVTPIIKQIEAENIADELGMFLAKKHHRALASRMKKLKEKLEKEDFDKEKEETEASIKEELQMARNELKKLGFDWQAVITYLGQRGLDEGLRDQIKESYGKQAPSFEASRYLMQITEDHKPLLVDYLKGKHKPFVRYKLGDLSLDELKGVFARTHSLYDRFKEEGKADLLAREMYDAFKHLYPPKATKPPLAKPTEYESPKEQKKAA